MKPMNISFADARSRRRVLLLSGTSEGPVLARVLLDEGFEVLTTVTTEEARENLFGGMKNELKVEVRGFTEESLSDFLTGGGADVVLDATHPFAVRITKIAHSVCERLRVPYIRYERADWSPPEGTLFTDTFSEAAEILPSLGTRIMFTIGSRQLKHFAHLHDCLELFARILPNPRSLEQARKAGFTLDRLIHLRPPFSREMNKKIFQQYKAEVLVTKASGPQGGVIEKVMAARELGIQVLMIRRPVQAGLPFFYTAAAAVEACRKLRMAHDWKDRRL
jgi:precorrin-6A/cobalt-precorrin-6A reductase